MLSTLTFVNAKVCKLKSMAGVTATLKNFFQTHVFVCKESPMFVEFSHETVWATQDLPIPIRARKLLFMGLRWQLGEWRFVKQEFEIDDLYRHLNVRGTLVLKVSTEDGSLNIQWDDAWAAWDDLQQSPELQSMRLTRAKGLLTSEEKEQEKAKPRALGFWIGTIPPETKCFTVASPWCANQF